MGDSIVAGAGVVVFKKGSSVEGAPPLILALIRKDGVFDLPKGGIDKGESALEAAKRECFEESSLVINDHDMLLEEHSPFIDGPLTLFCAESSSTPAVTVNPHTGILEHKGFEWVEKEKFLSNCLPYLTRGVSYFYSKL